MQNHKRFGTTKSVGEIAKIVLSNIQQAALSRMSTRSTGLMKRIYNEIRQEANN